MRARPTIATGLLAGLVAIGLPLLGAAPAGAAPSTADRSVHRPIPRDDTVAVYASGTYRLDVLANDDVTSGPFTSGDLTLCAVTVTDEAQRVIYAEIDRTDPSKVYLEANRNAEGIVTFTYDACQGDARATSTVVVDINRLATMRVTKHPRKRGRLRATNPNDVPLTILWGSNRNDVTDGQRRVRPGRTITFKVERTRIYYVAFVRDQGAIVIAGEGTINKIKRA